MTEWFKQPPILHSLLQKCKDIRVSFTDQELVKQCGDKTIDGKSEYDYFKTCRRIIYRFVKAWEKRLLYPFDVDTGKFHDDMGRTLADFLDGVKQKSRVR